MPDIYVKGHFVRNLSSAHREGQTHTQEWTDYSTWTTKVVG